MESRNFLMSMKQTETPLNTAFFCRSNLNHVHSQIIRNFKKESGLTIDRQNDNDLLALMRKVFIDMGNDPYNNVPEQVTQMNTQVENEALREIRSNVTQFMTYVRDMDKPLMPPETPQNTSIYGTRTNDLKF